MASSQGGGGKVGERVDAEPYRQRFIEAMDDDFNTPQALANLFDLARDINRASDEGYAITQGQRMLLELAGVLGLALKPWEGAPLSAEPFIQLLISTRDRLRQAEQWQLADEIRSKLGELGIALEDTPKGTIWKRKRG